MTEADSWSSRDAKLRERVLRGDEQAWRDLYDRAYRPVYAYIHRRTRGVVHRTEELVQEVWMIAVRRIRHFDPEKSPFESWLFGIGRNVLRNAWRTWRREDGAESWSEVESVGCGSQESVSERFDLAERVSLAITALPLRYQSVLVAKSVVSGVLMYL